MVRNVTQRMWNNAHNLGDELSPACFCDFGLETEEHTRALRASIVIDEITVEQLDEMLGDGPALTQFVNGLGLTYKTSWDIIEGRR